jgi:serine/threonine-protein kinase
VAVLGCLLVGSAAAQPDQSDPYGVTQPSQKITAESLFQEAAQLMERGDYAAACPKLEASEALDTAVGTLLYLADCYEHSGRLASAWARFNEARSLARAQNMPDRERIAAERVTALEPRLARLTLVVFGSRPADFSIRLGGAAVPAASWGTAMPLDAGEVEVEAVAPGYEPFRTRLLIPTEPGARITLVIPELSALPQQLDFLPAARAPEQDAPRLRRVDAGKAWRVLGITFAGAGAIGLVGGGVATALAVRSNDASLLECRDDGRICTRRGVELRDRAARQADIATGAVAAGGALVLTGILIYTLPGSKQREVRVALAPAKQGQGAVLSARGAF